MELILIILPLAFLHGWYVGRHFGIKLGAAGMFDQLYDNGVPVRGKLETRTIEISLKDE